MDKYIDRTYAGQVLAKELILYTKNPNVIVLALPRGGVPVGYEIAKLLSVPLDVFIVRKLGVPGHEELAMGAIATGGVSVFNEEILTEISIPKEEIDRVIQAELNELKRREIAYRGERPFPNLKGKTIILVDDGIATGATMRAAIKALRLQGSANIVVAVPVSAPDSLKMIMQLADKIVCPLTPPHFYAVGAWYENFPQTSDEEVFELLVKARRLSLQ